MHKRPHGRNTLVEGDPGPGPKGPEVSHFRGLAVR